MHYFQGSREHRSPMGDSVLYLGMQTLLTYLDEGCSYWVVYVVQMTMNVSNCEYDIEYKGQGQKFLKSVLWLVSLTNTIFQRGVS